jgi:hypothetical protein
MKTSIQTAVLVGALVIVVFLVTFVSQWVSSGETKTGPKLGPQPTGKMRQLEFPKRRVPEKDEDPNILAEMHPKIGHQDFWFRNPHDVSVDIGLEAKSCKCESVEIRLLSSEEEQLYQSERKVPADRDGWQLLGTAANSEPPVPVPPGRTGLIRLLWDGKEAKAQRLKIEVWSAAEGDDLRDRTTLECGVQFVPPFITEPATLQLPAALQEGQKIRLSFLAWSFTRGDMRITARERRGDPCFQCEITPLTAAECERRLGDANHLPIKGAYQVAVTVFAQHEGHALDLGPFNRAIDVVCDGDEALTREVIINGVVTGNIRLLTEDQKDWINIGDFRARDGKKVVVAIETDATVKNLSVETHSPAYLDVTLASDPEAPRSKKRWNLTVIVPPGKADGKLPRGSGITLKTQDSAPRRLKIPVLGHATND